MPELDELLAAFARLVEERLDGPSGPPDDANQKNFRCVDCEGCTSCRFCTACEDCHECTYCDASVDCQRCTQCRELVGCSDCTQSTHSAYCERGSYLTLCYECDACVHCFACVGLSGAEFCILNRPHTRREYFKAVASLRSALDAKSLEGWVPPWIEPEEPPASSQSSELSRTWSDQIERTGTWPPQSHREAREMDRGGITEDLWDDLEADTTIAAPALDDLPKAPEAEPRAEPPPPREREPTEAEAPALEKAEPAVWGEDFVKLPRREPKDAPAAASERFARPPVERTAASRWDRGPNEATTPESTGRAPTRAGSREPRPASSLKAVPRPSRSPRGDDSSS